jgi:hypothetical protein
VKKSKGSSLGDHPSKRLTDHLQSKLHERCLENEHNVKVILSKGGLAGLFDKMHQTNVERNREYFSILIKSIDYHVKHYIPQVTNT